MKDEDQEIKSIFEELKRTDQSVATSIPIPSSAREWKPGRGVPIYVVLIAILCLALGVFNSTHDHDSMTPSELSFDSIDSAIDLGLEITYSSENWKSPSDALLYLATQ